MITTEIESVMERKDAELVFQSLTGSREAFGRIVEQYQSLICSLAYSATGSLTQSEDVAQETFVVAWKQLRQLREPEKLRSWLCSIARSVISSATRRQTREPAHGAETMDTIHETPRPNPFPPSMPSTVKRRRSSGVRSNKSRLSIVSRWCFSTASNSRSRALQRSWN